MEADGKCFGYNLRRNCFVSFTLKKALLNDLDHEQGNIQQNLKFIYFSNPLLFNGFFYQNKEKTV